MRRQENGRRAIQIFNTQMRSTFPRCGAKAKSTGLPCRRFAMANGRCDNHGGRTPSGDGWHRPVWPNGSAPDAARKMYAKLASLERAARRRAARLAAMTPDEQEQYQKWHIERPVGSRKGRRAAKVERHRKAEAKAEFSKTATVSRDNDPEYQALVDRIAELKAKLAALEKDEIEKGVFG
ncbi:MAG: hypothetical protein QUV10_15620 [Paracoccaceae bacterium]|nr:hypothetical protein [Paracoccaceae bacterium]